MSDPPINDIAAFLINERLFIRFASSL